MELEKRDFSDFTKFPGVIDATSGEYHFPELYHTDDNKNTRIWSIKVRLIKSGKKVHAIDWNVMKDDTIPIKSVYMTDTDIPDGTNAQVWVETGVVGGKITRHAPTYPEITNEGKSNERNKFKQGLVIARSLYLKKRENGSQIKSAFESKKKVSKKNTKYFPMLVRKYDDEKKNIVYPVYIQPKLDGVRCISFLKKSPQENPTTKDVEMYSRQRKSYLGFDETKAELLPALIDMWDFENNESIYADGELYKHGMSLQDISAFSRNPDRKDMEKFKGVKYHVFDIFYPEQLDLTFQNRLECLNDLFDGLSGSHKTIVKVPTSTAKTEKAQNKMYKLALSKKYEGIIIRNSSSRYLTHPTKNNTTIRSKFVLKRKMTYDAEFEVVGFTQGKKGHDKGAIIWICKTPDTEKEFNATPKNISYEERYELFKKASSDDGKGFKKKYNGRQMTIEYEDLSKDKIPLRAKAVGFREHT